MQIPDNPKQPCLTCTKQWCLNQNLGICANAKLGTANPDTATGKEGDVEARCFRMYYSLLLPDTGLRYLCYPFQSEIPPETNLS